MVYSGSILHSFGSLTKSEGEIFFTLADLSVFDMLIRQGA